MNKARHAIPNVSGEQGAADDLIKQIRKLRWIGLESEARAVADRVRCTEGSDSVLSAPLETD